MSRLSTIQKPKVITVTVATAGSRQRLLTDPQSPYRFQTTVYFEADDDNSGKVFIGDENVADATYSTGLAAGEGSQWIGDQLGGTGAFFQSQLDLYNIWVDASANSQLVHVTVAVDA